jgi:hypothetical protein
VNQKYCRLCQTLKDIDEFAWKSKNKKVRQSYCKLCQNIRSKAHYQNNKERYIEKAKKRNIKILETIQNYIWNYLKKHPCIDCGETDIVVLEFDHESDKLYNISEMIKERGNFVKTKTEIEKCVVRCANCHRRKTARQFSWKKSISPR